METTTTKSFELSPQFELSFELIVKNNYGKCINCNFVAPNINRNSAFKLCPNCGKHTLFGLNELIVMSMED